MQGLHLTADLYRCRCDARWLTEPATLRTACLQALENAGLAPLEASFLATPRGVTGVVALDGSHLALHTWPARRAAGIDLLVRHAGSDPSALARALMDTLVALFAPEWTEQRSLERGDGE